MKKKLLIFIIINTLFILVFIFNINLYVYILAFYIIFFISFMRYYYKISILNIGKIFNIIKSKKIKKKLNKEEKYLEVIKIETFDGSNSTTHPYIIKLSKEMNKYKYYLSHTPYDNQNIELENPSISVTNDTCNFYKPEGIKDPILDIIKKNKNEIGKYYSDSFLLEVNGNLQLWYRYTEENNKVKPRVLKNYIYRISTKDGINFTKSELVIGDDGIWYLSPSIIKIKNMFYMYYFDKDLKLYCKTSTDLCNFNKAIKININNFNEDCWHGEVKLINDKIYLLLLSKKYGLYWCETDIKNPLEFNMCHKLKLYYYDKCNIYGNMHPYKSTFLIEDGYVILYIPFLVNKINWFKFNGIIHKKWTMTYTKLRINNLEKYIEQEK